LESEEGGFEISQGRTAGGRMAWAASGCFFFFFFFFLFILSYLGGAGLLRYILLLSVSAAQLQSSNEGFSF